MKTLTVLFLTLLFGCSGGNVANFAPSGISGTTPSGQEYEGVVYTRHGEGFEKFVVLIMTPGQKITAMGNSDTTVRVQLNRTNWVEATWGKSIIALGDKTETIQNEIDFNATRKRLEEALDNML